MKGQFYFVCTDLVKSANFYTELLGVEPVFVSERWIDWGELSCLCLLSSKNVPDVKYGSNARFYLKSEDINSDYEKVKKLGAKIIDEIEVFSENPLGKLFVAEDFDGNQIEFVYEENPT